MLENNKTKIINDFIEKNKNKLKENLKKCEIITRKDLENINDIVLIKVT